jgi:hypothetical protein
MSRPSHPPSMLWHIQTCIEKATSKARVLRHQSFLVKEQLSFDVLANEMAHAFRDFHGHPHRSALLSNKMLDDKHFNYFGNGGSGTWMEHVSKDCIHVYSHDHGKIAHPGSHDLKPFQNLKTNRIGQLFSRRWLLRRRSGT